MLRKLLPFLMGALVILTGSSCFDILEIIRLNKDGSGTYTLDMDLSEALEMAMQFAGSMDSTDEVSQALTETMDTTIVLGTAPDSVKSGWSHPELTSKASMQIMMDGPASTLTMRVHLPFAQAEDIDRFGSDLGKTSDLGLMDAFGSGEDSGGGPMMLSGPNQFSSAKGRLTRKAVDGASLMGGQEGDEDMEMMKMFAATTTSSPTKRPLSWSARSSI
jgi:hypothetical protein